MTSTTRRQFVRRVGGDLAVAGLLVRAMPITATPLGLKIGSQTWPHRAVIKEKGLAALAAIFRDIGVQDVEMCSPLGYDDFAALTDGKQVRQVLADHGLTCVSAHFSMTELRARQADSIAWAHDAGITQMITASLGGGDRPSMDDVKRAADEYNAIAAVAARAGMQQGLHNEGFELSEVGGRRTYDVLLDLLDPGLVKFQFQMSTITRGFDAADYFTRYPGRFFSIHLQDVDLDATRAAGPGARPVQAAVGKGSIDWKKTFAAARLGGVRNYYVEQSMDLTTQSVAYLKTLDV